MYACQSNCLNDADRRHHQHVKEEKWSWWCSSAIIDLQLFSVDFDVDCPRHTHTHKANNDSILRTPTGTFLSQWWSLCSNQSMFDHSLTLQFSMLNWWQNKRRATTIWWQWWVSWSIIEISFIFLGRSNRRCQTPSWERTNERENGREREESRRAVASV